MKDYAEINQTNTEYVKMCQEEAEKDRLLHLILPRIIKLFYYD